MYIGRRRRYVEHIRRLVYYYHPYFVAIVIVLRHLHVPFCNVLIEEIFNKGEFTRFYRLILLTICSYEVVSKQGFERTKSNNIDNRQVL